jgi:hypothetical protein
MVLHQILIWRSSPKVCSDRKSVLEQQNPQHTTCLDDSSELVQIQLNN